MLTFEEYNERIRNLKTVSDVTAFAKELLAPALQTMLDAEMALHLGYEHGTRRPKDGGERNYRNGHSSKTLKTSFGEQEIAVPRDREGSFSPIAIQKYETMPSDLEEKIVAMYAKGMTTRDINHYLQDIYGVQVSADSVSHITDKIMPLVRDWQNRPLSPVYTVVYFDGIHFKVKEAGRVTNRCAYIALGVTVEGRREILGIFVAQSEGAKFWMQCLTEIKNRGVADILIACIDGLTGFPEAIKAIFPQTTIQLCIVHQVRNSVKYVSWKHREEFCRDLRTIYTAPNEEGGMQALLAVQQRWPQYAHALKSWETKWADLSPFFSYPPELRKLIYTTNAIENLNRQFRKVTKTTTIFPHDDALMKLLWLAQRDITRSWHIVIYNWSTILLQLSVLYPDRITLS
jgi:transposase-like protein